MLTRGTESENTCGGWSNRDVAERSDCRLIVSLLSPCVVFSDVISPICFHME